MAKRKTTTNEVRIIGGKWRGRKLRFSGQPDLRPTLGRLRETLFNWIRADLRGARCLDLFAGSGALGFEALSQGAAHVTFVEHHRPSWQALKHSAALLDAETCSSTLCMDALSFLTGNTAPFDLIFVDPPFGKAKLLEASVKQIVARGTQKPLIYVESADQTLLKKIADANGLCVLKQTRAGEAHALLLQ
jgi:16S rRNA (guanine966-N2)-methyltransferase